MKRKSGHPSFDQTLELLRAHGFDAVPYAGVAGGALVSKLSGRRAGGLRP